MIVKRILDANDGDKILTSRALGITLRYLNKILERHRLVRPRYAKPLPIPIGRTDDEREA